MSFLTAHFRYLICVLRKKKLENETSMHSIRMRTTRLLTIWVVCIRRGVCIKGGLPNIGGVCIRRGVCIQGVCPTLEGSASRGGLPRGICPGGSASGRSWAYPTPPVNRMTHRCKNITLPKLRLRALKRQYERDLDLNPTCGSDTFVC